MKNTEGITMAIYSGYLAAWAIAGSLNRPSRKLFYQDTYVQNLKTRLTLFYLLTYPDKDIPVQLRSAIRESIINQSENEIYLTFSQPTLTSRAVGFNRILHEHGLNMQQVIRNIALPQELM